MSDALNSARKLAASSNVSDNYAAIAHALIAIAERLPAAVESRKLYPCTRCHEPFAEEPGRACVNCEWVDGSREPRASKLLGRNERDAVWSWQRTRNETQPFKLFYRYKSRWEYSQDGQNWRPCVDSREIPVSPEWNVPADGGTFTEVSDV